MENKNKLFVGNLSWEARDSDLSELFAQAGTVLSASVVIDRMTNRSKGFAFVEMSTPEEAQNAISMINEKEFMGRNIAVNISEPKPKDDRGFAPRRSFGGSSNGGSRFGGSNGGSRFGGNGGNDRGGRRDFR